MQLQLAQVNIARMLAPIDSPVMADFVANLDRINALAESSDGFIWRLKDEHDNATAIKVFEDDYLIINMSVWTNIDSLHKYVYQTSHAEIFKRRKEWFEKMTDMHMALWYVPEGHQPTPHEARKKLEFLQKNGETAAAFSFRRNFSADGLPNF